MAGMVKKPWNYAYSSVHTHLSGHGNLGIVVHNIAGQCQITRQVKAFGCSLYLPLLMTIIPFVYLIPSNQAKLIVNTKSTRTLSPAL
jgi:hypothetical protein